VECEARTSTQLGSARILIADDHDLIRDGFQRMLRHEPDLEVVGEAANGRDAIEFCRRLKPDLVLMDVRMPEMDGLEATRAIKAEHPSISVLMVTTYENPNYLLEAIGAGAAGYILKDTPKREMIEAVRKVLNGESSLSQDLAIELIRRLYRESRKQAAPPPAPESHRSAGSIQALTARELEVLRLMAQGKTNRQIAEELVISKATTKVHVRHIILKLEVSDRIQAVLSAIELGLVDPKAGG